MNHLYFFRLGYYDGNVSAIKKKYIYLAIGPMQSYIFRQKHHFYATTSSGGWWWGSSFVPLRIKLSLGFVFGATFSFEGGYINNMIAVSLLFEDRYVCNPHIFQAVFLLKQNLLQRLRTALE